MWAILKYKSSEENKKKRREKRVHQKKKKHEGKHDLDLHLPKSLNINLPPIMKY